MKIKRVKCKSGLTGWQAKLRDNYGNKFEQFLAYADVYNIPARLGYKNAKTAWQSNPTIQGSVNPSDLRKVKA